MLTADARRWAALEVAAAADPSAPPLGPDGAVARPARPPTGQWESFAAGGTEADVELLARGSNDCWVAVRSSAAGRMLTAATEGDRDRGLTGFAARLQKFCDEHTPGAFEGVC